MRYLMLSDIHANFLALDAVLNHAKRKRWDKVLFLGDAIGYYPQPNEVLKQLIDLEPEVKLLGNHEDLLFKLKVNPSTASFREDSAVTDVIKRHLELLSPDHLSYLEASETHVVRDSWEATHGGLRSQWEYITSLQSAQDNALLMKTPLLFVGHTHVPRIFASVETPAGIIWRTVAFRNEQQSLYRIPPKAKIIFNPGSVGQSRDGIPLASYAIFDEDNRTLELFRVEYDLLAMQRLVREQGYPEALANRLAVGK
jgi:predicted phosphodiesterase